MSRAALFHKAPEQLLKCMLVHGSPHELVYPRTPHSSASLAPLLAPSDSGGGLAGLQHLTPELSFVAVGLADRPDTRP